MGTAKTMSNFDFNFEDYKIRQFRIWAIIFGAWLVVTICGGFAKYGNITDRNVQELIVFAGLTGAIVIAFGFYTSFVAWVEKKLFQYGKKIDGDKE